MTFTAKHRIRQGDSLAPLLFIIVLEILRRKLQQGVTQGDIELYNQGGTRVESHLPYADDVIIFYKLTPKCLAADKQTIDKFCDFSRLQINTSKSFMILSTSIKDKEKIVDIIGLPLQSLSFSHLGVPMTGRSIKHTDCLKHLGGLHEIL